jgi:hypothetical protein
LSASQPEDVELYVKMEDAIVFPSMRSHAVVKHGQETASGAGVELKERFMEALRESGNKGEVATGVGKGKAREKSVGKEAEEKKVDVGVAVGAALRRGGRGRPVQVSQYWLDVGS